MRDKRKIVGFSNYGSDCTEIQATAKTGKEFEIAHPTDSTLLRIEDLTYNDEYKTVVHPHKTKVAFFIQHA